MSEQLNNNKWSLYNGDPHGDGLPPHDPDYSSYLEGIGPRPTSLDEDVPGIDAPLDTSE